jgi:hypothetical protein
VNEQRPPRSGGLRRWLVALSLLTSACVLPVGPQFEDPPGNAAPYLASSNPPQGAILSGSSTTIEVVLGDANQEDVLVGRWFIDYPPFDSSMTRMAEEFRLPGTGRAERSKVRFAPSCADDQIALGLSSHRVTLSVADRPFLPPEQSSPDLRFDSVPSEGFALRATWILNLTCP